MIKQAFRSRLGGLWVDRLDAAAVIVEQLQQARISPKTAGQLFYWMKYGYLILDQAVNHELIAEFTSQPIAQTLNIHGQSQTVSQIIFASPITDFLRLIFRDQPIAFRSNLVASTTDQNLDQDVIRTSISSPLTTARAWIALEDTGEKPQLWCYEQSQQISEYFFAPNRRYWQKDIDGQSSYQAYQRYLQTEITRLKLSQKQFELRRGDVVMLAADLIYGVKELQSNRPTALTVQYCTRQQAMKTSTGSVANS